MIHWFGTESSVSDVRAHRQRLYTHLIIRRTSSCYVTAFAVLFTRLLRIIDANRLDERGLAGLQVASRRSVAVCAL